MLTTRYRVDGEVAAAAIAETSCCRLQEEGERGRARARIDGIRGWEGSRGESLRDCNKERRCIRARGTFDEAAIERTPVNDVCMRRRCRCVDAGRAQMPRVNPSLPTVFSLWEETHGATSSSSINLCEFPINPGLLAWVKIHPGIKSNSNVMYTSFRYSVKKLYSVFYLSFDLYSFIFKIKNLVFKRIMP